MGGSGSGRWGGRATVQSAATVAIYDLIRSGAIERGEDIISRSAWRNNAGEVTDDILFECRLSDPENEHVRFVHRRGKETISDYIVDLDRTPQPFGGDRLWFICPRTGERAAKLRSPRGAHRFLSREAWRLAYYCQRSSPRDRAIQRLHKKRRALGGEANPFVPISKPYRMRWATFDAKMADIRRADGRASSFFVPMLATLQRRTAKMPTERQLPASKAGRRRNDARKY